MQLYVGNVPFEATAQDLKEQFGKYGATGAKIIKDHATGRSKGYGFVDIPEESVQKAIDEMNNSEFMGAVITVNHAGRRAPRKTAERKDAWKYKHIEHLR